MRAILAPTAAALALIFVPAASAQDFSAERLSDGIRAISTDEYAGRFPGAEGERLTLAWLQAQYEAIGLEPGGPDGQWLQPVTLMRFTPTRPPTGSWSGPDGAARTLEAGKDFVARTVGESGRIDIANAPLAFVGHGVDAPEREWDDFGDIDLTGKIMVVMSGEPEDEIFNGAYRTLYSGGDYKLDEARARGAVGVLTITPQDALDPRWARRSAGPPRGRMTIAGEAPMASLAVNRDVASALFTAAGLSLTALMDQAGSKDFEAVDLEGVTLSLSAEESAERIPSHNLLARLPGTERPDETIVLSAHWDHIGVREPPAEPPAEGEPAPDLINNGAWDNASGTVALVEMARALKAAGPQERAIVFLHVTAEEQGLLGSDWYAENPVYPLETTVANINIDMISLAPPTRDLPIFGLGQNTLEDDLQALATAEGRTVTDDGNPGAGFYYRSDHFNFARAGVPALMPWHGVDWDEGGLEAGKPAWAERFGGVYHQPDDEWSPDWRYDAALEDMTLLYRLVLDLASSERWPGWKPLSEFAAVRAESEAARR